MEPLNMVAIAISSFVGGCVGWVLGWIAASHEAKKHINELSKKLAKTPQTIHVVKESSK